MTDPISEGVNFTETSDETHSLTGREPGDVNSAGSSLCSSVTSEEVVKQIKAVTDSLTKQLERFCDLLKNFQEAPQNVMKRLVA